MNTPIKLKIALQDLPHKCERTLLIPHNVNMLQVHFLIQESMGWLNAHFFEFSDKKGKSEIRVGIPDDFDIDFGDMPKIDATKGKLKNIFIEKNESKPFWYWYDFGDDWWHRITFLKVTKKDLKVYEGVPICIKALGKCPPEDVGGPWGYADFLETIKNKRHPEYSEMRTWYGLEGNESYNEQETDIEEINQFIMEYYNSKNWSKTDFELF